MYSLAVRTKTRKFVDTYGKSIVASIRGTGLFFPAMVAQKALESGWGESGLTKEANNFGGIKYNPNLSGVVGSVTKDTTEYIKGKKTFVKQKFSKFRDAEAGLKAVTQVLLGERYAEARLKAKTPEEQILMIAKAGYTTYPPQTYLNSMKGIIEATQDYVQLGRIV